MRFPRSTDAKYRYKIGKVTYTRIEEYQADLENYRRWEREKQERDAARIRAAAEREAKAAERAKFEADRAAAIAAQ